MNNKLDIFFTDIKTYEQFVSLAERGNIESFNSDELNEVFYHYVHLNQFEEDWRERLNDTDFYKIAEKLISLGANLQNPSPLLFLEPPFYGIGTFKKIKEDYYSNRDRMTLNLLKWGAKTQANFKGELSPFNLATLYCDTNIVQMFLDNGAKPNDNFALLSAISSGNLEVIELLLKSGADPNITLNLEELTPEAFENPDEIEINNLESLDDMPLIINRVKSPFKDDKCLTELSALHLACCDIGVTFWDSFPPQPLIVKLLIDYGANVNAMCKSLNSYYEYTALDCARQSERLNGGNFRLTLEDYDYDENSKLIVDLNFKDEREMLGKIIFLLENKQANYHTSSRVLTKR